MNERRSDVSDVFWLWFDPHLPDMASFIGATTKDNHRIMEAVFQRVRAGSHLRGVPHPFGD
jgi:transposase